MAKAFFLRENMKNLNTFLIVPVQDVTPNNGLLV